VEPPSCREEAHSCLGSRGLFGVCHDLEYGGEEEIMARDKGVRDTRDISDIILGMSQSGVAGTTAEEKSDA
jgi:hypothetical protein